MSGMDSSHTGNLDAVIDLKSIPYQLPTVALVLNFTSSTTTSSEDGSRDKGPLLSLHEVETLHHEYVLCLYTLMIRQYYTCLMC